MNTNWKSLGWSAAAVVLLLTLATPLNAITFFLVMTPFVVLYTTLDTKKFILHLLPIGAIAFLLSGALGPIVVTLALFFLVPAVVMGHLYKKGKPARTAVTAAFVILLAQILLGLLQVSMLLDFDIRAELTAMLAQSFKQFEEANLFEAGWAANTAQTFTDALINMLPLMLLGISLLFAVVGHGLSRLALRMAGFEAPALPKASTWRVPKSMVFYFLIVLIASYAISEETGGYWRIAVTNLVPILQFVFLIQAIGFFFFLAEAKKWPKAVPVLICIPLVLFPQSFIIGLLDAAFPLRKSFVK
ncbi:DUF2232 domain-containing protein [Paenibacillaceae bacterium WGS1546]|uniref:DUF2232 domain-containing protein n=1 Tax=Cohnella sp. WGS1546 TaxID=3366810 RepID=UPI00372D5175